MLCTWMAGIWFFRGMAFLLEMWLKSRISIYKLHESEVHMYINASPALIISWINVLWRYIRTKFDYFIFPPSPRYDILEGT